MLLEVEDNWGPEMSMATTGDVGSGLTSANPVMTSTPLVIDGVGSFAGVIGREGWNDLAAGLREGPDGFPDTVGVLSESLISPSSLEVDSTVGDG